MIQAGISPLPWVSLWGSALLVSFVSQIPSVHFESARKCPESKNPSASPGFDVDPAIAAGRARERQHMARTKMTAQTPGPQRTTIPGRQVHEVSAAVDEHALCAK